MRIHAELVLAGRERRGNLRSDNRSESSESGTRVVGWSSTNRHGPAGLPSALVAVIGRRWRMYAELWPLENRTSKGPSVKHEQEKRKGVRATEPRNRRDRGLQSSTMSGFMPNYLLNLPRGYFVCWTSVARSRNVF